MRDIMKYAEQGEKRISDGYRLRMPEVLILRDMAKGNDPDGVYRAIEIAFHAGCEAGARAAKKNVGGGGKAVRIARLSWVRVTACPKEPMARPPP
ncbi:MAG: hypothetical protein IJQ81_07255 [Oscillibacter sp.]|nr:hypothetical protein [Oscillibacter sp.]